MNAYELAEQADGLVYEIPADWSSGEPKNVATEIANMLRQQADRIAELEKECSWAKDQWNKDRINLLSQLDTRTRELIGASFYEHDYKTLMADSEPVAWVKPDTLIYLNTYSYASVTIQVQKSKSVGFDIPLYTTPHHASDVKQTKPLSDEEIIEMVDDAGIKCGDSQAIYFARAIEAKVRGDK